MATIKKKISELPEASNLEGFYTLGYKYGESVRVSTPTLKGNKGDTGQQGPKGDTGSQGPKGDTGSTGPMGAEGKPLKVNSAGNYEYWDEGLQNYVDSGIPAAATVDIENVSINFAESAAVENIYSGDKVPAMFGKISKWFTDKVSKLRELKTVSKSVAPSQWVVASGKYVYTATDIDIIDGCYVSVDINEDSIETAEESELETVKPTFAVGSFTIKARKQPTENINFTYTIF